VFTEHLEHPEYPPLIKSYFLRNSYATDKFWGVTLAGCNDVKHPAESLSRISLAW